MQLLANEFVKLLDQTLESHEEETEFEDTSARASHFVEPSSDEPPMAENLLGDLPSSSSSTSIPKPPMADNVSGTLPSSSTEHLGWY